MIGDSLTDPKSHGGGYLDVIRRACPSVHIRNLARGGTMTNQMLRDLKRRPKPARGYTHVVVFGGVNDLMSNETAARTNARIRADLQRIYAHSRSLASDDAAPLIIALTVAPWGDFRRFYTPERRDNTQALNRWIRYQAPVDWVVDAYALLSCGDPERLCERYAKPFKDGIHFGSAGHERLGQVLLKEVFRDCEPPEAGQPEAGQPEAGESEAGESEAGESEAGEPEAGEPEAGEPEAGNGD